MTRERRVGETGGECTAKRKGSSDLPRQPRPLVSSTISHHVCVCGGDKRPFNHFTEVMSFFPWLKQEQEGQGGYRSCRMWQGQGSGLIWLLRFCPRTPTSEIQEVFSADLWKSLNPISVRTMAPGQGGHEQCWVELETEGRSRGAASSFASFLFCL